MNIEVITILLVIAVGGIIAYLALTHAPEGTLQKQLCELSEKLEKSEKRQELMQTELTNAYNQIREMRSHMDDQQKSIEYFAHYINMLLGQLRANNIEPVKPPKGNPLDALNPHEPKTGWTP